MTHREQITDLLAKMSLSQKVGQMLMIGFDGTDPATEIIDFIRKGHAGGVILFNRNGIDSTSIARLTESLRKVADETSYAIPLFIAIDQEGGSVVRIISGVTIFPGNMALGATGRNDYAYLSGRAVARELAAIGININLAPVLDVNNNPDNPVIGIRSFGEDPNLVAGLGVEYIKGQMDGGVMATAKHFPGHGDTAIDSHLGMPVIPHSARRLTDVELLPFRAAIASGVNCIMAAHVAFPKMEPIPGLPATLSPTVLNGMLRKKLGFPGLIMTDCLEMQAISKNFGVVEAAVMAIKAGADQVLISHSFAKQQEAHAAILEQVEKGSIPVKQIEEAVQRILTQKLILDTWRKNLTNVSAEVKIVRCPEHLELARKIAADSLTLVRNNNHLLPIRLRPEDHLLVISFQSSGMTMVEETDGFAAGLAGAISHYHRRASEQILALSPDGEAITRLIREMEFDRPAVIIIATQDAWRHPGQARLVKEIIERDYPLIVAAMRSPYDLRVFPEIATYVAAYGFRKVTLEALAELLWGRISPKGCLPVSIPDLYLAGHGMQEF